MTQLAQFGAQGLVNDLAGLTVPAIGTSAPTWFPGLYWANGTGITVEQWNGTAWVTSPAPGNRYLALLTSDPVVGGAVNITDAGFVELTTGGYTRQQVTFSQATSTLTGTTGTPAISSNTNLITFGPMITTMLAPVQWVALVTSTSSAPTTGYFLASWQLAAQIQVQASQNIQIGIGQLVLQGQ